MAASRGSNRVPGHASATSRASGRSAVLGRFSLGDFVGHLITVTVGDSRFFMPGLLLLALLCLIAGPLLYLSPTIGKPRRREVTRRRGRCRRLRRRQPPRISRGWLTADSLAFHGDQRRSAGPSTAERTAQARRDLRRAAVADIPAQHVRESLPQAHLPHEGTARTIRSTLAVIMRPRVAVVLVFGLGVLILLLLGYIYLFTPLSFDRAQHGLLQQITADPAKTFSLAEGGIPAEGSPIAVLQIPSLHLLDAVVQGTDAQDLRSGPGHLPTTSMPGQPGNAVIAGRRATFGAPFGAIGSLKKGQVVTVVDGYGTYHYKVKRSCTPKVVDTT